MAQLAIFVIGHPASGKSTLAARLAADVSVISLHRDHFKEVLFDTLGSANSDDSRALGRASYALLETAARAVLANGHSLIIDANYTLDPGRSETLSLCRDMNC